VSDVAIRVEGLGKQYRIGGPRARYRTIREAAVEAVRSPFRRLSSALRGEGSGANGETIWALKDVSFEVERGEVVGIIGRNGAGKSTLLKVLSRIAEPTEGWAEIHGRVGSLLEVGTGFHPELTGRENIYLSGAVLGMRRGEIDRRFDEIVDFSGVEQFLDTPLKHYSSGMQVRLGFAVAAHLELEILLVDEVLAVGDAEFQEKCLGKMGEVARGGRTVLFVSHNLDAVAQLTTRALLLDMGKLGKDGGTDAVIRHYRKMLADRSEQGEYVAIADGAGVLRAKVVTSEPNQIHRFGEPLKLLFEIDLGDGLATGGFAFQIVDRHSRPVVHSALWDVDHTWPSRGRVSLSCVLPSPRLYMGHYSLTTHLGDMALRRHIETVELICEFSVVMGTAEGAMEWIPDACAYVEDVRWRPLAPVTEALGSICAECSSVR